jgi:3-deoxy-manno-octulosonate cytidylyltransferase (CMP-KDO synthetase)
LGLYAYQRDFLVRYAKMEPVLSERAESLEQLRALHYGFKIGMGFAVKGSQSVDTASDLEKARDVFKKDFL